MSEAEIVAATGEDKAQLDDRGIAVNDQGDIFFTDKESHSLLMQPGDGGPLEIVATKAEISAVTGSGGADPKSLANGPDGAIYLAEDKGDSIVRFDPFTGEMEVVVSKADLLSLPDVSSVDLDGGMVVSADGTLYAVSDGDPDTIFAIDTATGAPAVVASGDPFQDLDAFITLAPNGDLIVADDKTDTVYRVDTGDGSVSTFLSKEQIETVAGDGVDLEGGIAFDADGNFYLADEKTDGILKWPADDADAGTINPDAGEVFVTDASISAVTGEEADLEAGIFFGTDGSASFESLEITISGVPDGATLSAGTDNGDGSWTLTSAQLTGLTVTPPADSDADFTLTVTAAATEAEDGEAVTVRTFGCHRHRRCGSAHRYGC